MSNINIHTLTLHSSQVDLLSNSEKSNSRYCKFFYVIGVSGNVGPIPIECTQKSDSDDLIEDIKQALRIVVCSNTFGHAQFGHFGFLFRWLVHNWKGGSETALKTDTNNNNMLLISLCYAQNACVQSQNP